MNDSLFQIFIGAVLANNFVLAMFLGFCPFLGVSKTLDTAFPMGCATTFVMFVASLCAFAVNKILVSSGLEFLRLISYIVIIASFLAWFNFSSLYFFAFFISLFIPASSAKNFLYHSLKISSNVFAFSSIIY